MISFKHVRKLDLFSFVLLAFVLASFSAVAMLGLRPAAAAIPDHLLDRVRGASPNTKAQSEGSCTGINVNTANSPPAPNPPYADGTKNCTIVGQPCIICLLSVNSFIPVTGNGNISSNGTAVNCNPPGTGSGQLGSCTNEGGNLLCNPTGTYDCSTFASQYPSQRQGGG